jgi:hypothetical protein
VKGVVERAQNRVDRKSGVDQQRGRQENGQNPEARFRPAKLDSQTEMLIDPIGSRRCERPAPGLPRCGPLDA